MDSILDESLIVNKNNPYHKYVNDENDTTQVDYCWTVHQDLLRRQRDEWHRSRPYTIEDGTKHTPFIIDFDTTTRRKATVVVGNGQDIGGIYHPMMASDNPAMVHFISSIYVVDQNDHVFAFVTMDPTQPAPAQVIFDVPKYVTEMTAYEFCNLHGLYKGPTVLTTSLPSMIPTNSTSSSISSNATATAADTEVTSLVGKTRNDVVGELYSSSYNTNCHVDSPVPAAWDSFAADFVRRQSLPPFNSLTPYNQLDGYGVAGTQHTPFMAFETQEGGYITATVKVGTEGNYHEMKGVAQMDLVLEEENDDSEDGDEKNQPHWITHIYVVDQIGGVMAMLSLDPTNATLAQLEFTLTPDDATTTLTAYAFCNVHGLYQGPTYSVANGEIVMGGESVGGVGGDGDEPLVESSVLGWRIPNNSGSVWKTIILVNTTVATAIFL